LVPFYLTVSQALGLDPPLCGYPVYLQPSSKTAKGSEQCRINKSSKCSNYYEPRAFEGPAVFCNKSYLLHYI